ncbi:Carboxypeptidase A2 [Trichinella spiralis]|uniref:Carboxypeptidase A2 n=1 Tax=Trichinella spiralis TaxID=6334 RepID=A0A0V1BSQ7_TRISP|nr:Carboxypeptidase A2 [Trichinella spiralis]
MAYISTNVLVKKHSFTIVEQMVHEKHSFLFVKQYILHSFRKAELNTMMLLVRTIFAIGLLRIGSGYSNKALETYQGHILLEAVPSTEQQLITLQQLIHYNNSEIDVWTLSPSIWKKSLILVAPQHHYDIYKRMLDDGIKVKIAIDHLKSMFATHANIIERRIHKCNFSSNDFDISEYHTYDEIAEYMKMISSQHPNWTELISVGYSFEGRELLAIKIGTASSSFWIDAGIHSREWISVSSAVFIIGQLHKQYNLDTNLRRLLSETVSWIILPVFNPDGYQFTWKKDRLWRKSRSKYKMPLFKSCIGVDLNRNFDMDFGGSGSSSNPCSNVYHGKYSFSEPETRAVMRYLSKMQDKIKACISLHSFGQLWLMPYGNKQGHYPTNYREMVKLANGAVKELRTVHRSIYKVLKASDLCKHRKQKCASHRCSNISTGVAADWILNATSIKYAFTVELRPETPEKGGFILPEKDIVPTGEEISLPCLALKTCSRTEACRIVEYHKLIIENGNMEAVDENNSGAGGSLRKETNSSIQELRDEASFTIASEQLCACPSTDSPCAFDNETDNSENVIQINSGTMLILCQSKERLPSCRDFRRPVVRLFKDLEVSSDLQGTFNRRYTKARIWCRCTRGEFKKSKLTEIWMYGMQHADTFTCNRLF